MLYGFKYKMKIQIVYEQGITQNLPFYFENKHLKILFETANFRALNIHINENYFS